jgi:hypothetical protein
MISLHLAALLAALLFFCFAILHGALAFGAPLAAYAWGGQSETERLPPRLQLGSTVLAPFIAAMAIILLIRGGWIFAELAPGLFWAGWAIFLFVVTQMFGALRSKSRGERRIMAPAYAVAAALCAVIAFTEIATAG